MTDFDHISSLQLRHSEDSQQLATVCLRWLASVLQPQFSQRNKISSHDERTNAANFFLALRERTRRFFFRNKPNRDKSKADARRQKRSRRQKQKNQIFSRNERTKNKSDSFSRFARENKKKKGEKEREKEKQERKEQREREGKRSSQNIPEN